MMCMFNILRLVFVHYCSFTKALAKSCKQEGCTAIYDQEMFQLSRPGCGTIPSFGTIWEEPAQESGHVAVPFATYTNALHSQVDLVHDDFEVAGSARENLVSESSARDDLEG